MGVSVSPPSCVTRTPELSVARNSVFESEGSNAIELTCSLLS